MERWHRCSRWTSQKIPCPYGGLVFGPEEQERGKDLERVTDKVSPLQQTAKAAQAAEVPRKATSKPAAAGAAVESPVHLLIEDDVSIRERQALPGGGPVPLWGDAPAIKLAKTWTTPTHESGMADLIYANPGGPGTISTLPLVGIRQGTGAPPTGPGDPLLQEPQKVAVRPTSGQNASKGPTRSGQYPLMEAQLAAAMAGRTPPVPKVTAIGREAPRSIEQEAWNIQSQVAIVAGAIAVASITAPSLNPANVAGHMEKVITKTIQDKTPKTNQTANLWKNKTGTTVKSSTGRGGGRRGGMKGGAFQTRTIWEGGIGARRSVVADWEKEIKRVSQDASGFSGLLG